MALHGNIQVNHNTIGEWSAQRAATEPDGGNYIYLCRITYTPINMIGQIRRSFFVEHNYNKSAMELTAKVMLGADAALNRAPSDEKTIWDCYCGDNGLDPSILGSWVSLR